MDSNYFESEKNIKVVACHPGKAAQVIEIKDGLKGMQEFVGGHIEAIYPFDDPVAVICNEEGKLANMELNRALCTADGEVYDIVAGSMFICGLGEEDFTSLQGELLEKYLEKFKQPEVFVKIGNNILAMKIPEKQQQEAQSQNDHIHRKM